MDHDVKNKVNNSDILSTFYFGNCFELDSFGVSNSENFFFIK